MLVESFTGSTTVKVGNKGTECTPVLVRVTAAPAPPEQQLSTPLDVVALALLDFSSSTKEVTERMKLAMSAVIKNLDKNDRLSLVSLGGVQTMLPTPMNAKGRATATKTITDIRSTTTGRLGKEALQDILQQVRTQTHMHRLLQSATGCLTTNNSWNAMLATNPILIIMVWCPDG